MLITELKQTAPERFVAVFDDGRELDTTLSVVADFSLYSGRELTEEEYRQVCNASSLSLAKARALQMIGMRAMSKKELTDRLIRKGESPENAEVCVRWLESLNLLDDAEYAAMLARHYSSKNYGVNRIKNELYRRGVPKELWDEALEQIPDSEEKIHRLISARLKGGTPGRAELKKVTDFLLRRGYTWEEIKSALNRYNFETEEY
ncbi:MAG: regulatory protein RecX [Oscillospiraceae bacterium]|jgi:regulatory protein